jgi:penicillin-binding protein 2
MRVINAMKDVVHGDRGTARRSGSGAEYQFAGKTGTAQVIGLAQGRRYDENAIAEKFRDHALFIAFAPVEEPKIAVAVIAENGGGGSRTAAPIARKVMDYYLVGPPADTEQSG